MSDSASLRAELEALRAERLADAKASAPGKLPPELRRRGLARELERERQAKGRRVEQADDEALAEAAAAYSSTEGLWGGRGVG